MLHRANRDATHAHAVAVKSRHIDIFGEMHLEADSAQKEKSVCTLRLQGQKVHAGLYTELRIERSRTV